MRQKRDLGHEPEATHRFRREACDLGQFFGGRILVHIGVADEQRAIGQQQAVHRREHRRIGMPADDVGHVP
jgi:hypothetical protein